MTKDADDDCASPAEVHHDESALIASLLAGDEAAFRHIVDAHTDSMIRLAEKFVPGRAVAEEVVQDVWLAVLIGLPRFEGRSSIKTWVFQILVNRAKAQGSRERRASPLDRLPNSSSAADTFRADPMIAPWTAQPSGDEATDRISLRDTMAVLQASIAALPQRQALVITLRDVTGLSAREVCEKLKLTGENQRVLLHRARAHVRGSIDRSLFSSRE